MKLEEGRAIYELMQSGTITMFGEHVTIPERVQIMMGACLLDDGSIWCLKCDNSNESCSCNEDIFYQTYFSGHDDNWPFDDDIYNYELEERNARLVDASIGLIRTDGLTIKMPDPEELCDDCGRSRNVCDCNQLEDDEDYENF